MSDCNGVSMVSYCHCCLGNPGATVAPCQTTALFFGVMHHRLIKFIVQIQTLSGSILFKVPTLWNSLPCSIDKRVVKSQTNTLDPAKTHQPVSVPTPVTALGVHRQRAGWTRCRVWLDAQAKPIVSCLLRYGAAHPRVGQSKSCGSYHWAGGVGWCNQCTSHHSERTPCSQLVGQS